MMFEVLFVWLVAGVISEATTTKLQEREWGREAVMEAAEYGLKRMNELVLEYEPKLYGQGMWLNRDNPASYVAAFNGQSDEAKNLAKYGYASLQASSKLMGQLLEGRGTSPVKFPVISLLNTPLYDECPLRANQSCSGSNRRYRTADSSCNNPAHPWWGAAMRPLHRFLLPNYRDGLERVRESVSGGPLPSARAVSSAIHGDRDVETPSITHMVMQWGQFLDHDLTSSSQSRGFNGSVPKCCSDGGRSSQPPHLTHPDCLPISVPPDDQFYTHYGVGCLEFVRSSPAPRDGCSLGPRDQINQVTSFIDGSVIYGSNQRRADHLRLFRSGLLKYSRVQYRLPLLPGAEEKADLCRGSSGHVKCFWAGDTRVNEQPGLAAMHTVWLRAHNRLATELSHLNPHWGDEKLYQETRRILGAMMQHITFKEFLPIVLGQDVMRLFDLELLKKGYSSDYDIKVNPTAANSFGTAAFRFGHSLVQRSLVRCDSSHQQLRSNVSLHEELTNPSNLYNIGSVDRLLLGLCMQPSQRRDEFITKQLTNHLFQTPKFHYGMDLAALNIQRGRDHGLAPYNAWRAPCGLQPFTDWQELLKVMSVDTQRRLRRVYRDVDDIDLFPGGMAERPVTGGLVGPTFACILAQQFSNLRKGDRFWYENSGFESSFTPSQLQHIRRMTLARLLCDNLDTIATVQPFVFLTPDEHRNKRVSCDDHRILKFDLTPWVEHHKESSGQYPSPSNHHPIHELPRPEGDNLPSYPLDYNHHNKPQDEEIVPSYLIDDNFQEKPQTEGVKPTYLINEEYQEKPNSGVRPTYLIEEQFQEKPMPEGVKPSYLIDDKYQQTKPPHNHYTTTPSYNRPHHHTSSSYEVHEDRPRPVRPSYSKPHIEFITGRPIKPIPQEVYPSSQDKPHPEPENQEHSSGYDAHHEENLSPIYLIHTDENHVQHTPIYPKPLGENLKPSEEQHTIISKPVIHHSGPHHQNPSEHTKPRPDSNHFDNSHHSPNYPKPHHHHHVSISSKPHDSLHTRPSYYTSTGKPEPLTQEESQPYPSHYEEYSLRDQETQHKYSTATTRPDKRPSYQYVNESPKPLPHHDKPSAVDQRPFTHIGQFNEPSYYFSFSPGQSSSYFKLGSMWLPDRGASSEKETVTIDGGKEPTGGVSITLQISENVLPTPNRSEEWSFDTRDVSEQVDLPEVPPMASDPEALRELPHPIIIVEDTDEEESVRGL